MKVGDLVDFCDNKGNKGIGIINRIRTATDLDLRVKRKNGKFQLFLSVPKGSTENSHLASWSPIEKEVTQRRKESFRNSDKEHKKETFSSEKGL